MVKNKNLKPAFSFAEVLVGMLIMSIFFLASTKIMTQRQKDEVFRKSHGFFECYYDGGQLYQAMSRNGAATAPESVNGSCTFRPNVNSTYFQIIALYPNGSNPPRVYMSEEVVKVDSITMTPPSTNQSTAIFGNEMRSPDNTQSVIDYESAVNTIQSISEKSNIVTGNKYGNGCIIISW